MTNLLENSYKSIAVKLMALVFLFVCIDLTNFKISLLYNLMFYNIFYTNIVIIII